MSIWSVNKDEYTDIQDVQEVKDARFATEQQAQDELTANSRKVTNALRAIHIPLWNSILTIIKIDEGYGYKIDLNIDSSG